MNLARINEYWHLLEAVKAGKQLQLLTRHGNWEDLISGNVNFNQPPHTYRVKPEPVTLYCVWWEGERWYLNDYPTKEQAEYWLIVRKKEGIKAFIQIITKPEDLT